MEFLQTLCADVAANRTWADEGLRTKISVWYTWRHRGSKNVLSGGKNEGGIGAGRVYKGGGEGPSGRIVKW